MTKHTPGPWVSFIPKNSTVVEVHDKNGLPIIAWSGFDDCRRNYSEQTANARLIAAAPQMLEALELLLASLPESEIEIARECWGNTNTKIILFARNQVKAAIDAAKGD